MGQLVVIENVTLDGVMQAPGRPDEDPSDGFAHGGWAVCFELGAETSVEGIEPGAAALLFGRRTYTDFAGHRPHRTDGDTAIPLAGNVTERSFLLRRRASTDLPPTHP